MTNDETFFNDLWCIYFHDPLDTDWTNKSYKLTGTISSIDEYWQHFHAYATHVHQGMFFIMREHIFPCWDDPNNINGGCLSIKVLKDHVQEFWEDLSCKLLGETLLRPEHVHLWDKVCGISTSPKKHFCIIKLWVADQTLNDKSFFDIIPLYYGDIIFKSNKENIAAERG